MLIRTPTAQIEVLGTRFYLSAQPVETAISVEAGQIRMRRLADERTVNVAQGQVATASLNVEDPMEVATLPPAPAVWRQTFEQPPPARWRGKWQPADASGPGRLQNVPDFSHRRTDGTPVAAYTVNVRDKFGITASVSPETVLRVKFRTAKPRPILILTGLHQPTGWFAGNFQTMIQPAALQADADGWYTWQAPLSGLEESCPTDCADTRWRSSVFDIPGMLLTKSAIGGGGGRHRIALFRQHANNRSKTVSRKETHCDRSPRLIPATAAGVSNRRNV